MNKIVRNGLLLSALLLSSCELSMEEYIVSEEDKGKEEPCTEVSEYGEITYQYHDDVTALNGEPQNYIAMMNDSVIWFMDNLPDKWVPKEGHYIAANCSRTIPLGICSKVRSVTRDAGMIRVEHEPTDKENVFKKLEMRLDFNYIVPGVSDFVEDGTEESRSTPSINRPGFWKNDSVFVDMSLYEPGARSDGGHEDKTKFQTNKSFDLPNKKVLYVDLTYESTEVVNVHQYEDLVKEYKEEWNDSYTERNIKILIGYGNNPEEATKSLTSFPKNVGDIRGMMTSLKAVKDLMRISQSVKAINPVVSIPSFPFGVMFRVDVSVGYVLLGYGVAEMKFRSETRRNGYIINKGNSREIDNKLVSNPLKPPYSDVTNIQFGGSADFWLRGRIGVGVLVGNELGGVGGVVGIEGKVGFRASLETESLNDYSIIDRQNFNCGFYANFSGFGEGLVKVGPFTKSLGDFNFNTTEKSKMINMKAEINDSKTKSNLTTEEVEYVLEDENGNPLIDPWTGTPMIGTRDELSINSSLNFSKLETFFIFPKIDRLNQRPALRIYEGEIASGSGKFKQEVIDEVLAADKTYKFSVNLRKAELSENVGVYEVVPCIYDKGSGMTTEYRNNSMIVTPGTPIISQPKCYQWFGRELSVEDWEYYLEEYGEEYFKGKKREDFTEYAFTTVVELKNATRIKEWGMEFRLEDPNGKAILDKAYSIPFDGLCRAGKYTIITTFISQIRPKPNSGIDALYITAVPYCIYDGEKKRFARSRYINFYYPYERDGGPYTVGTSISQDL
ncbi:MAG: hypothetical protein PUC21_00645 [Bacteroidales bacterium]|nr:hypothetical protein [Bacteroidales bacterium]